MLFYRTVSTAYFYTLYDPTINKPRCAAIQRDNELIFYDLYRPGAGKKIKLINDTIANIRQLILDMNDNGYDIVTSNFKKTIGTYDLPIDKSEYNVYDIHFDDSSIRPTNSQAKDKVLLERIIERMSNKKPRKYQRLISNAGVAYQYLENRGIYINDELLRPQWSMSTFSGRSKTTGFNIQGFHENCIVRSADTDPGSVLIHFDWIAADIRIASILSQDELLIESFVKSDPYDEMAKILDTSRQECKIYLLKSINSIDINSEAFAIYEPLGKWLKKCYDMMSNDSNLETVLHRKFKVSESRGHMAVLNGVMQGSVAHAMHNVLRRIWDRIGSYIVAEVHDSIILSVPNQPNIVRSVIDIVLPIMTNPFYGLLDSEPFFPVKVSIGKKWKQWRLFETHRLSGVEKAKIKDV